MTVTSIKRIRTLLTRKSIMFKRMALGYIVMAVLLALVLRGAALSPSCDVENCLLSLIWFGLAFQVVFVVLLTWWLGSVYQHANNREIFQLTRIYEANLESLEEDRLRLETVMNQMPDGVIVTDPAGKIHFANPASKRLLQSEEIDVIGQSFAQVAFHHELIDLWQKCRIEREEFTAAIELEKDELFLQAVVSPTQPNENDSCIVILQDLTHIRRLETIRRDFISNVSHELLTPIASLRALIETLQDGAWNDPPAAERFLNRAADEVVIVAQIVRELLTLSRIEAGHVNLALQPTDISELLLQPIERLRAPADRKQINLILNLTGGMPKVLCDTEQIWQVVTNIVHNAIKYTPPQGTISVSANLGNNEVVIAIKDTGLGIPKDDLPRIFERFYKADRARQRSKVGGTGLGLAIAKHIIQAHNGRIWAKSKPEKGSTLYFSLPIAKFEDKLPLAK